MRFLTNDSTDPHWNMAFDEMALTALTSPEPLFYLWQNRTAVIIGRNQSAPAEVNLPYLEEHGIVLARRVTGGGAVYHDLGNLNYSFVGGVREMDALHPVELIASALRSLGVPAEVSGRNDILVEGRKCSGYAKRLALTRMMIHGTLMWNVNLETLSAALSVPGSKFVTSAIASVRSKVCNLSEYLPGWTLEQFRDAIHDYLAASNLRSNHATADSAAEASGCKTASTSLRPLAEAAPPRLPLTWPRVATGFEPTASSASSASDTPVSGSAGPVIPSTAFPVIPSDSEESVTPDFLASVNALADKKFRSWDWIHGSSPATDFTARRKFPSCGTVCAHFSVRHGLLADLSFSGDFLGALPSEDLASDLNGTRFTPEALSAILSTLPVASYFDGLTAPDLLSLFF